MAFKTKEEMFGDGGGFGAIVPFSVSNAPGTGPGNRGVQFGEQLTAAIANRPHYALALNDENLNTRLASFEAGGLDASYRNGSIGPAGGGREVTKDGGAVETVSSLTVQYADDIANAHFRSNQLGDTSRGGGFDARTGFTTAAYSYMSRSNMAFVSGGTNFAAVTTATLNPGGVGATIVRLSGGGLASTAGATGVSLNSIDFIEVTNAPGMNGLYTIHSLGPSATDFLVRRLDGSSPAFTADTLATVRPFRTKLLADFVLGGSIGSTGLVVSGGSADAQALAVVTGDTNGSSGTGPTNAVTFFSRATDGVLTARTNITGTGQIRSTLSGAAWSTSALRDAEMRNRGGIVGSLQDRSGAVAGTHEIGLLFKDVSDAATSRSMAENWVRLTETSILGLNPIINATFAAPAGRVLLPDSDGTPASPTGQAKWFWTAGVVPGVSIIEMLSGANQGQHYLISAVNHTGVSDVDPVPDEMTLVDMDGNTASLPTSGSFTFRLIAREFVGGFMPPAEMTSSPDPSVAGAETVSFGSFLRAPSSVADNQRALALWGDLSGSETWITPSVAGPQALVEKWVIRGSGNAYFSGAVEASNLQSTSAPTIIIPSTDTIVNRSLLEAEAEHDSGGNAGWWYDRANSRWECRSAGAHLYLPILFSGRLMSTILQVFNANTGLHLVEAGLMSSTPLWGTPGTPPTISIGNNTTINAANAWNEITISHSSGLGTVISLPTASYAIRIIGNAVGDQVRAIRHTVRHTTIGAGGIGG